MKDPEVVVQAETQEKEELTPSNSIGRKDVSEVSRKEIEAMHDDKCSAALTETQRKLLVIIRNEGIPLSKTLQRLVQRSSVETVESALAAFKEQQEKGLVLPVPLEQEPQLKEVCDRLTKLRQCNLDPFEVEILSLLERPVAFTPLEL